MPANVAKPDPLPWLMLREAISNMSGPGVAVSTRQAVANRANVERSSMLARLPVRRRHLEFLEQEAWRHGRADQRPRAQRPRRLPDAARHDGLRPLAESEVDAEPHALHRAAILAQRQLERRAGVVVPELVGIDDLVPMRALAGLEQEVDR